MLTPFLVFLSHFMSFFVWPIHKNVWKTLKLISKFLYCFEQVPCLITFAIFEIIFDSVFTCCKEWCEWRATSFVLSLCRLCFSVLMMRIRVSWPRRPRSAPSSPPSPSKHRTSDSISPRCNSQNQGRSKTCANTVWQNNKYIRASYLNTICTYHVWRDTIVRIESLRLWFRAEVRSIVFAR